MFPLSPAVDGVRFLVVDMTPVTRSDSSGAHFIHDLAKDLKAQGIQLVLCNPTDVVSGHNDEHTRSTCKLKLCSTLQWIVWLTVASEGVKQGGREGGSQHPTCTTDGAA